VAVVGTFSRWKRAAKHKARRYKDPQTYIDRIETEIDSRVGSDVSEAVFSHPRGAVTLGLAVGLAVGASKDLRRLMMELAREMRG
jgi:hypothetical protein